MERLLEEHFGYLSDRVRLARYRAAIAARVKPGDVVVDVGCGSGVLGLACLEAGAAHLVAIEKGPVIEIARETLARAGFADRCTFVRQRSYRVALDMRADIAICDHVGYFGFDYDLMALLADARGRFLKPEGATIPARLAPTVALVASPRAHAPLEAWRNGEAPDAFGWLADYAANTKYAANLTRDEIVGQPAVLDSVELGADARAFLSWRVELVAGRGATVDGLAGWFDCELAPGVVMTNSPLAADAIRRPQAFLPFPAPVAMKAGERVLLTIAARPHEDLVAWSAIFPDSGRSFSQSTWASLPIGRADVARADPRRRPNIDATGRARALVLALCDGVRTAREIEEAVARQYPRLMPTEAETRLFVAETLARDAS